MTTTTNAVQAPQAKASTTTTNTTATPKKVIGKAVSQPNIRKRLINKAGKVASLPITLEKGRLACLESLGGYSLTPTWHKGYEVTAFGHKVSSKAGACDVMLITALAGNVDLDGLVRALVNADSAYGRSDTAKALAKRVHEHLGMKRNGETYFDGAVHATRPHGLTLNQRLALGAFGADIAFSVKAIIASVLADMKK